MGKKLQSVLTDDLSHCIITGDSDVAIHHVFNGPNRKLSEKYGFVAPLKPTMNRTTVAGKTSVKNLKKAIYKENFMTKEQKIEAYARRLDGESYQSIADSFGVTRQYIYLILHNYNETNKLNEICIYKGLGSFLEKKKMTLKEFTELLGCNCSNGVTLKKKLKGLSSFTMDDIRKLLKITGMTFEECFELKN